MIDICYQDTATFVKVSSGGYGNDKTVTQQIDIPVVFIQNTQLNHARFQDSIDSDAICFVDPNDPFVIENYHRLEGMYILEPLFGAGDDASWYKIIDVTTNRDHLLGNMTDNVELKLKKTRPIAGVS